jgi:hypothetical protein
MCLYTPTIYCCLYTMHTHNFSVNATWTSFTSKEMRSCPLMKTMF